MKNRIFWLICGAYVIDVLFDLSPRFEERYDFFPFFDGYDGWDGKMTLQNYVYGYCQHVFLIMILHAVHLHTSRRYWDWLMWLEVLDAVDYALHYNHTLFTIHGFDVEFNYFKFLALVYLTHKEYGTSS